MDYMISTDLYFIAAKAAVNMENYMLGRGQEEEINELLFNQGYKSVKDLSQILKGIIQENLVQHALVLGYAISGREEFKEYWKGKDISDLLTEANSISDNLWDFRKLPEPRQKYLIGFCVNLSREVMIYRNQMESYTRRDRLAA